jgi:hypothetical protein
MCARSRCVHSPASSPRALAERAAALSSAHAVRRARRRDASAEPPRRIARHEEVWTIADLLLIGPMSAADLASAVVAVPRQRRLRKLSTPSQDLQHLRSVALEGHGASVSTSRVGCSQDDNSCAVTRSEGQGLDRGRCHLGRVADAESGPRGRPATAPGPATCQRWSARPRSTPSGWRHAPSRSPQVAPRQTPRFLLRELWWLSTHSGMTNGVEAGNGTITLTW